MRRADRLFQIVQHLRGGRLVTAQKLGKWLEVRASNARARSLYARRGFNEVGLRRGYYPAAQGQREDAVVMSLNRRSHDLD